MLLPRVCNRKNGILNAGYRRSIGLRSVERAHEREIELASTELVLAATPDASPQQRSSFPFSIPLPADTPQCLHTSRSSLAHILTATVIPLDEGTPPIRRTYVVHTRRFTSHTHELPPTPETWAIAGPSRVEVQLPRTTFRAGEPLPIYLTVPTPTPDLVVEQGVRLRNLRAELVRVIHVKSSDADDGDLSDADFLEPDDDSQPTTPSQKRPPPIPSTSQQAPDFVPTENEYGERKVMALSGASCRLHPARPLRIRLVLHPPTESPRPSSPHHPLPSDDGFSGESDVECASITQSTLLHSVSFRLLVHATFMNMSSHTERVCTQTIPLYILPPAAPLPEVEPSVDAAYLKKHDQPPTRTVRLDDMEVPQYSEAGPSAIPGAPPPFEEREAPPPFWSAEAEASTSSRLPTFLESEASTSRLPTFLESEREIYVPPSEDPSIAAPGAVVPAVADAAVFAGEGALFGFRVEDQFDGYAELLAPQQRSGTPPPSLEMATRDADVTGLASMDPGEAGAAIEALGLALDQQQREGVAVGDIRHRHQHLPRRHHHPDDLHPDDLLPPPPPPPMDDPSDPPPSIDSAEFRAPGSASGTTPPRAQSPPPPPPPLPSHGAHDDGGEAHGHAPPPYRVPDIGHDVHEEHDERVVHPPPYVDLVHEPQ